MSPVYSDHITALQCTLPEWPTGLASRGLMLRHLKNLLPHRNNKILIDTLFGLARWRWQLYPWDKETVAILSALSETIGPPLLPEWARPLSNPVDHNLFSTVQAIGSGQAERVLMLWQQFGMYAPEPTWLGETCLFFLQRGDADAARQVLETTCLSAHHPVKAQLYALFAFVFEAPEIALQAVRALSDDFQWLRMLLEAQCLLRLNDLKGNQRLHQLWQQIPWHPNLTLALHALLTPELPPTPPSHATALLAYSWNNADLLNNTLSSLSRCDLKQATLHILDNGSSDDTAAVLKAYTGVFADRMKTIRLPVNIGAPAARNWLLRHPDIEAFQTVVFLDDDVLLPPEWLTKLSGRFHQLSATTILGCRIMDQFPRQSVQMADVNLLDIEEDGDFLIANSGGGELDLGLHAYSRPCLSVTGCCHMMNRQHAEHLGGFDLRFNPSQFDDFDLDLRNILQGGHAYYSGNVAIRHCQRSSLNQADNPAKQGHIQGNLFKLNSKYSLKQKKDILTRNRELLWEDLIRKTHDLGMA